MPEEHEIALTLSRDQLIKHWLLHLAIECPIPLRVLFPFRWPTRNARAIPDIQAEDLVRNLLDLFDAGLIVVASDTKENDAKTRSGFMAILDRFLALTSDKPQTGTGMPRERVWNQILPCEYASN
jgi:hypothetical protein